VIHANLSLAPDWHDRRHSGGLPEPGGREAPQSVPLTKLKRSGIVRTIQLSGLDFSRGVYYLKKQKRYAQARPEASSAEAKRTVTDIAAHCSVSGSRVGRDAY